MVDRDVVGQQVDPGDRARSRPTFSALKDFRRMATGVRDVIVER